MLQNLSSEHGSNSLQKIIDLPGNQNTSVEELIKILGLRSIALIILLFSIPNSLPFPSPPGFSTVFGIPLMFFAVQIMLGRQTVWLPKSILKKNVSLIFLKKVIKKVLPIIHWIENWMHPRWKWVSESIGLRLVGGVIFILALVLSSPIPGGNLLPGLSITLISIALLEKDGLFVVLSSIFGIISLYLMYNLIIIAFQTIINWVSGTL